MHATITATAIDGLCFSLAICLLSGTWLPLFVQQWKQKKTHLTLVFIFQIKIWFQNRRTKWKRKYTNDIELLAQQYYSSLGIVSPRPMFVGDRLWVFNYPNRIPATQQQQWLKSLAPSQTVDRNVFRSLPKPDIPPFYIPVPGTFPNERIATNLDRNYLTGSVNVKIPAQNRLLPREVYNNMATAQRTMDAYKNNILNHANTQESNVDHLRRLEENFSIWGLKYFMNLIKYTNKMFLLSNIFFFIYSC